MSKHAHLQEIMDTGILAVVRMQDADKVLAVVQAIREGGITCIEITMTTPKILHLLEKTADAIGDRSLIGVGTVLDAESAHAAILAGAQFIVTPTLNLDVIAVARRYGKVVISGGFTPTEILAGWEAGADLVKIFPATSLGPQYVKDIKGPLPQVELVPTGGVNLDTIGAFLKAGVAAVAVGGALLHKDAIAAGKYEVLTESARQFTEAVREARA